MADVDKYLIPSETAVVITRRHWASLLRVGTICTLVLVLGLLLLSYASSSQIVAGFAVLLVLGSLGWFGWKWGQWYLEEFIITDRRVLLTYGILTRRVGIMPLIKVTDLTYERTLTGRILGYGAFVVESAGQHQAFNKIDYLPSPDRLYHDVSLLLFPAASNARPNRREYPTAPLPGDD
jgi:hypothetical protein